MTKIILTSVLFLAVFATPTFAAPPRERYEAALLLLQQSDAAVTMALATSDDPLDPVAISAAQAISFALGAAEKAVTFKGGDARTNAQSAATTALLGSIYADMAALSDNATAAQFWSLAASTAYEAAYLLDRTPE